MLAFLTCMVVMVVKIKDLLFICIFWFLIKMTVPEWPLLLSFALGVYSGFIIRFLADDDAALVDNYNKLMDCYERMERNHADLLKEISRDRAVHRILTDGSSRSSSSLDSTTTLVMPRRRPSLESVWRE